MLPPCPPPGLASGHQAPEPRRSLRNLLRQLASRINRLDGRPMCQWCPRTGVSHVPGL